MWKDMSDTSKAPYETKAKKDLEKYHKLMDKYKLTDNYKKFQELKAQSKVDSVKKTKFRKDENAPKRPANGYFLFMTSKKDALVAGGMKFTEASKKCGELWSKLSEAGKKPFEDEAAALKKKYEVALAKYHKTAGYKKYAKEKAEFDANKKDELKKVRSRSRSRSAKKPKAPKSKSRSRSRKRSRSAKRSAKKPKAPKAKSRSRSRKRSRSRSAKKAEKPVEKTE